MNITTYLLFVAIYVFIEAFIDYRIIGKNKIVDHTGNWMRRIFIIFFFTIFFVHDPNIERFLSRLAVGYTFFYLLFDPVLNTLRGKPFFYLGKTAKWDNFLNDYPVIRFLFELVIFLGVLTINIIFFR